jgi:hypothetical protein
MNLQNDLTYHDCLQPVPQWDVIDSSKLTEFMSCPRKYFYRYILGWAPDIQNIHLGFGTAWHEAIEYLIQVEEERTDDHIQEAFRIFLETYRLSFDETWDEENAPKNPAFAFLALGEAAARFNGLSIKVLHTEVPGTIPITDDKVIHFKIDCIAEGLEGPDVPGKIPPGMIGVYDWKTSSQKSTSWGDQWRNATQPKTYIHAVNGLYGIERVFGVYMYGTAFRKMNAKVGAGWMVQHIGGPPESMMAWMWNTRHWFSMIDWSHQALAESTPDDTIMEAFPPNTTQCTAKFGTCPYIDFCEAHANPLKTCAQPPAGKVVEHWDPRDRAEGAATVLADNEIKVAN